MAPAHQTKHSYSTACSVNHAALLPRTTAVYAPVGSPWKLNRRMPRTAMFSTSSMAHRVEAKVLLTPSTPGRTSTHRTCPESHAHRQSHMPTGRVTCLQSHAHSHMPTGRVACPQAESHAHSHMPTVTCPESHAQSHMPRVTCPELHAHRQSHMPTVTCPQSHAYSHMPTVTCPQSHAHSHMYKVGPGMHRDNGGDRWTIG